MCRFYFLIGVFLFLTKNSLSQNVDSLNLFKDYKQTIVNGDTIYIGNISPVYIVTPREFVDAKELQKYQRLVRNVKKVYPYAKLFSQKLKEINLNLSKIKSKRDKKAYLDSTEVQLRNQFEKDLVNMTVSQGKILIKLMYRETGNTSYELLKDMKGTFSAFFWQSVARLFGSSLKTKYDADGEDKDIEEVIKLIENGQI